MFSWWFDLLHDRAVMPNLCACCGVNTPVKVHEVYGQHTEFGQMELAYGIGPKYGKFVYDRMRVPICFECHKRIGAARRIIFSLAAATAITVYYVTYSEILPALAKRNIDGIHWFIALLAAVISFFVIRFLGNAVNHLYHPESDMAQYDKKSGRFTFRNVAFQDAFTKLNLDGYYRPDSRVTWNSSA